MKTTGTIKRLLKRHFPGKNFGVARIAFTDNLTITWASANPDSPTVAKIVGTDITLYHDTY